jgi:hypothetical protein
MLFKLFMLLINMCKRFLNIFVIRRSFAYRQAVNWSDVLECGKFDAGVGRNFVLPYKAGEAQLLASRCGHTSQTGDRGIEFDSFITLGLPFKFEGQECGNSDAGAAN